MEKHYRSIFKDENGISKALTEIWIDIINNQEGVNFEDFAETEQVYGLEEDE